LIKYFNLKIFKMHNLFLRKEGEKVQHVIIKDVNDLNIIPDLSDEELKDLRHGDIVTLVGNNKAKDTYLILENEGKKCLSNNQVGSDRVTWISSPISKYIQNPKTFYKNVNVFVVVTLDAQVHMDIINKSFIEGVDNLVYQMTSDYDNFKSHIDNLKSCENYEQFKNIYKNGALNLWINGDEGDYLVTTDFNKYTKLNAK
jgi:hypothetical protein